jgi:dienelactone hydrolase
MHVLRKVKLLYQPKTNGTKFTTRPPSTAKAAINTAAISILIISTAVFFIWNFSTFFNSIGLVDSVLHTSLLIVLTAFAAIFCSLLISLSAQITHLYRIAVLFTCLMVIYMFYVDKVYGFFLIVALVLFPSMLGAGIFLIKRKRKIWNTLSSRQRMTFLAPAVTGALGLAALLIWMTYPGPHATPLVNAALLGAQPPLLQTSDPSAIGQNEVQFLTYGSGKDKRRPEYNDQAAIITPTVDGALMLKSWTGLSGKLRTSYFGFDNTALPLNACVWYPKGAGPFPLVLILHGNHLAQDYSERGYEYLGKLLASRGYIVASIDENFLNASFTDFDIKSVRRGELVDENAARGWLVLNHLQLWRQWNRDSSSRFFKAVDMDKIALIGHSCAGEAIFNATLFNKLPCFPDDANQLFDFNFNIRSCIAIAPTEGQYRAAGTPVPLTDVNYLVLQGSHDTEVSSYDGMNSYYRVKFSPNFKGFKAGLYIHRANHGQFNSRWGKKESHTPGINKYSLGQLMNEEDQQKIAKVYISAFLDATLKDVDSCRPLFMDYRVGRHWLPNEIYLNQFASAQTTPLASYDEDLDLSTTTLTGGRIQAKGLTTWREQGSTRTSGEINCRDVYIGWNISTANSQPSYTITLPDTIVTSSDNRLLVFSLAAGSETSGKQPIDFSILLTDKLGSSISFPLSSCSYLQPRISKNFTKFTFLHQHDKSEPVLGFFYFDLSQIMAKNPVFNAKELQKISFVFDKTPEGQIILDDVGIM